MLQPSKEQQSVGAKKNSLNCPQPASPHCRAAEAAPNGTGRTHAGVPVKPALCAHLNKGYSVIGCHAADISDSGGLLFGAGMIPMVQP